MKPWPQAATVLCGALTLSLFVAQYGRSEDSHKQIVPSAQRAQPQTKQEPAGATSNLGSCPTQTAQETRERDQDKGQAQEHTADKQAQT